ncbi:hypothetical protein N658DRAFT_495060 [Parathielavia hyrcaniae]|uniref:Uncharacterized protein n=1 Tax=Parathielavia hyrcaniae TaxID=113614 RepID=A0AAN6Q8R2_9PEZI|nr:hypothetical protein N658DRAFT_495060 [Parathielavia hyrcaniae]
MHSDEIPSVGNLWHFLDRPNLAAARGQFASQIPGGPSPRCQHIQGFGKGFGWCGGVHWVGSLPESSPRCCRFSITKLSNKWEARSTTPGAGQGLTPHEVQNTCFRGRSPMRAKGGATCGLRSVPVVVLAHQRYGQGAGKHTPAVLQSSDHFPTFPSALGWDGLAQAEQLHVGFICFFDDL